MIDLSHLTEEEQAMIMVVLKRDTELKKSEEERIKQVQKVVSEEDRRKYMTGEWFYEVKSQRHQDRIHGSDIIIASMKQTKPTVVEYLTKSWGGRSRSVSRKNSEGIITPKQATESSDQPKEKENSDTSEVQQERLNIGMRSPCKPRHNPIKSIPMELDFEETNSPFTTGASGSGLRKSFHRDSDSQVKHQEESHIEDNTEVCNIINNRAPCQKPVPKKRTKIYKPQSSVSDSDSSVSTQCTSTTACSGIRSPPQSGILKYTSSFSSNESALKRQLLQPVKTQYVPKNSSPEKDSKETRFILESTEKSGNKTQNKEPLKSLSPLKLPKSRLPVRASSQLFDPPQAIQEKPKIQPRLSLSSITRSDDDKKVEEFFKQKRETDCCLPQSSVASEGKKRETVYLPHENARSALITNSEKLLDEITAPQPIQHKSEKVETHMTQFPNMEMARVEEHLRTAVDEKFPSALNTAGISNKADVSTDCETDSSSPVFNIKSNNTKQEDAKLAVMTDSHIPKSNDEQGDSITKVLEWFSRSTDSSDLLDLETNDQDMEEDTKIDDIDFEDEVNLRAKTKDNVYMIIPRQSKEKSPEVDAIFLEQKGYGMEQGVDEHFKNAPKERRRSESTFHKESLIKKPSIDSLIPNNVTKHPEANIFVDGKVTQNKKKTEAFIKRKEEIIVNLENTDIKLTQHQPKERTGVEENQPAKLSNLKSFWEKENIGPKILISRSNVPAKNEPIIPSDVSGKPTEGVEDQKKAEQSLIAKSPEQNKKESINTEDILDLEYVGSTNTNHKSQAPIATDNSNDVNPPLNNQKKVQILASAPSVKEVRSLPRLKSSSLDSGSLLGGQNSESMGGTISISSSDGDPISPKELEVKSRAAPGLNPVSLVKQNSQQQENMAERIKQLKSFWERETLEPRTYIKSAAVQNKSSAARLNKRFTKSEFDLRSIGTEFEEDLEDNTSDRGRMSPNFTLRKDKPNVTDGMSFSQFKNLQDFWGASPTKQPGQSSPIIESGIQRSLSPHSKTTDISKETCLQSCIDATSHTSQNVYNIQSERAKAYANQSQSTKTSLLSSPAKIESAVQSPSKKKITTRQESGSKTDHLHVVSGEAILHGVSYSPQPQNGSQTSSKKTMPLKPAIGQQSRPLQSRRSSKGSLNGKANSMRRASSMFSVNSVVEEQSQGIHLQSKKGSNLHQVKRPTESSLTQLRKTQDASFTPPQTSPEISRDREKSLKDHLVLLRILTPNLLPDPLFHVITSITLESQRRSIYTPPPVREQVEDLICTSFTTSPETSRSCKCSLVRTSTPVQGSPDLQTRKGSLGLHSSTQIDGDASREDSESSAADTLSGTKGNSNRDNDNPVQRALRRAASRPVYHKSMEDISSLPRQDQKIKPTDDSLQGNYVGSSTLVQTSFATADPEHLKQLSKSVPSFLQKESDGGESDSESSFRSSVQQRNNIQFSNLSSYSGSASLSSVSSSVASVYSSDYSSLEVQGNIQFSLNYVQRLQEFHIFVIQCQNLAAVDTKRNRSDPYVKSYLIPDSVNLGKRKTAVKKRTLNPTYNEILRYRVRMEYLKSQILNLSVWHNDTFGRNGFLGEIELDLSSWDFNDTERKFLPLKPRNLSYQTTNSLQPSDFRAHMKLAIRFLPQITHSKNVPGSGEVHIWVKNCKNLPLIRSPSIDPYVKCFVLPDTSKKSRQKTRVLKRTTNPIFNHTMVYDGFRTVDLKEACVELTVWDRDLLANHPLGGLRLSMGTGRSYGEQVDWMDSTAEEVALWKRMMESPNEWVEDMLPLRQIMSVKNT
ncbi:LOW QUALITY PROTEIN: synaptotagmin-like protein 2 [Myxocyprinus asiaticus]|uniref:LOW QUALITY PROTEIN: synaptotagmin-like protein 2 n=1 Tax=Myxocyprinus asiaticus TaxID=70543 RepID=UPI00222337BC|nr:LOW QUALITY PROTEIN: synaptotagmin-like protein 2 [Myxocyprinus asiaticus]